MEPRPTPRRLRPVIPMSRRSPWSSVITLGRRCATCAFRCRPDSGRAASWRPNPKTSHWRSLRSSPTTCQAVAGSLHAKKNRPDSGPIWSGRRFKPYRRRHRWRYGDAGSRSDHPSAFRPASRQADSLGRGSVQQFRWHSRRPLGEAHPGATYGVLVSLPSEDPRVRDLAL